MMRYGAANSEITTTPAITGAKVLMSVPAMPGVRSAAALRTSTFFLKGDGPAGDLWRPPDILRGLGVRCAAIFFVIFS